MTTRTHPTPAGDGHASHPDWALLDKAADDVRVVTPDGWVIHAEAFRQRLAALRAIPTPDDGTATPDDGTSDHPGADQKERTT